MRLWVVGVGLLHSLVAAAIAGPEVIHIADGDREAFETAVCQSNGAPGRQFELILAVDGRYDFQGLGPGPVADSAKIHFFVGPCHYLGGPSFSTPALVEGQLRIRGRGAELSGYGLRVARGATLDVEDLDFNLDSWEGLRAIHNLGTTSLERVSIANGAATIVLEADGPKPAVLHGIAIDNEGQLKLTNVGLYQLTSYYRFPSDWEIPPPACVPGAVAVYNSGDLEMTHVTSTYHQIFDQLTECLAMYVFTTPTGRVRIRNSAFLSEHIAATGCIGPVRSLGHNYFGRANCVESLDATDVLGPAPFFRDLARTSGYRRAVVLPPEHPAAKAIPGEHCAPLDQRGFPRLSESNRCDMGALEGGAPPAANPGTVTGLWFQPESDGHYLQLSFVRPDEVLLTWQTFDDAGANLWIYGLGQAQGQQLKLRLFRNLGPVASDGRILGGADAVEVGHAVFTLRSCAIADFAYTSELAGLNSGQLEFRRLAFTEGIACDDG